MTRQKKKKTKIVARPIEIVKENWGTVNFSEKIKLQSGIQPPIIVRIIVNKISLQKSAVTPSFLLDSSSPT